MILKDSVAVLDAKGGAAQPGRRGDAVGAEIPVTIHASRTTQGLNKKLPSVHEDTKTVIVLQHGAVVRLTAALITGETVVLTNRQNGADVLCRVGNVKTQPGIQHYVDLEFIQRAPGFWGDSAPAQSAPPPGSEAPAAAPAPVVPLTVAPPVSVSAPAAQPASVAAPPQIVAMPVPKPVPAPDPLAELATEILEPVQRAESAAHSESISQPSLVTPIRPPSAARDTSDATFGAIGVERVGGYSSGAKRGLLGAAAAVLLVVAGGAGGYWFFGQRRATPSAPALQAMNVPSAPATPDRLTPTAAPVSEPVPPALSASAPAPEPQTDIVVESRPPVESPANRLPSAPITTPRTSPPAARRNTVPIGQLQAPKAKTSVARVGSTEPPPMMVGAVNNLGDAATGSSLLVGAAVGPAPPPGSAAPTVGGQLQPPQVLSTTPPVYPQAARMQNQQGVVVLDVLVDEKGNVVETKVIAGPQLLLGAAQDSLRTWKYRPAQLNGKPISVHTKVSVRFNLH